MEETAFPFPVSNSRFKWRWPVSRASRSWTSSGSPSTSLYFGKLVTHYYYFRIFIRGNTVNCVLWNLRCIGPLSSCTKKPERATMGNLSLWPILVRSAKIGSFKLRLLIYIFQIFALYLLYLYYFAYLATRYNLYKYYWLEAVKRFWFITSKYL